ncbi:MAG: hypothetical protein RXQ96_01660 [Thermocladium sp.]|jgi:hypothetical protein
MDIGNTFKECLEEVNISIDECIFEKLNCKRINDAENRSGIYVFLDDSTIYYVGESNNIGRRVGHEHCKAHIGGSEAVVRFLIYYLDDLYREAHHEKGLSIIERERLIRDLLMRRINSLSILVLICDKLIDHNNRKNPLRIRLEKCLIDKLNPVLNSSSQTYGT